MGCVQDPLPLPTEQELSGWIPSERFPSDHLSLVFDFRWRQGSEGAETPDGNAASSRGQRQAAQATDALHRHTSDGSADGASQIQHADVDLPAQPGNGLAKPRASQPAAAAGYRSSQNASSGRAQAEAPQLGSSSTCSAENLQGQHASSSNVMAAHTSPNEHSRTDRGPRAAQGTVLPAHDGSVSAAVAALRQGAIVALPTDTLYGLAACANNQQVRSSFTPSAQAFGAYKAQGQMQCNVQLPMDAAAMLGCSKIPFRCLHWIRISAF